MEAATAVALGTTGNNCCSTAQQEHSKLAMQHSSMNMIGLIPAYHIDFMVCHKPPIHPRYTD